MDEQLAWPAPWCAGMVFAASGLDGWTDPADALIVRSQAEPGQLQCLNGACLQLPAGRWLLIGSDSLLAAAPGALKAAWAGRHSVVMELPDEQPLTLTGTRDPGLALCQSGRRACLARAEEPDQAQARAEAGLGCDIDALLAARLEPLAAAGPSPFRRRCLSLLRLQIRSPEAAIARRWACADRLDNERPALPSLAWQALAWSALGEGDLAAELLHVLFERQRPDGQLPARPDRPEGPAGTAEELLPLAAAAALAQGAEASFARACDHHLPRLPWSATLPDPSTALTEARTRARALIPAEDLEADWRDKGLIRLPGGQQDDALAAALGLLAQAD